MKYMYILTALCLLTTNASFGQKKEKKPDWLVHGAPKPSNSSFRYKIAEAYAVSPDEAQKRCLENLVNMVATERKFDQEIQLQTISDQRTTARGTSEDIATRYAIKTTVKGQAVSITFEKADEYMEFMNGRYRCYALYAVAENAGGQARFDHLTFTTRYGVRGFVRSMVVPGWGQMYKGSTGKGICILGGEVVLAGGIIATESLKQSYLKKIKETHNVRDIQTYSDNADACENIRNICIGAATALYLYNLIDAATASGRKRTVVNRKMAVVPSVTPDYTGVGIAFVF